MAVKRHYHRAHTIPYGQVFHLTYQTAVPTVNTIKKTYRGDVSFHLSAAKLAKYHFLAKFFRFSFGQFSGNLYLCNRKPQQEVSSDL